MTAEDVNMRVSGIEHMLEKEGPLTIKEIAYRLKKAEGWAGMYLQIGERQGVFYRHRVKQPVKWNAVKNIPKGTGGALLPPAAEPVQALITELPVDVVRTLRVLSIYHQTNTMEETIAFCIRAYSAQVVIKDHVSLSAIEEELNRHDVAMARLRKGA
jgi:hypothetical protein